MSNQVCPTCKGKKQYYRRCFPTVLSGWIDCGTCNATGEIDEQKAALIEMGKDIKAKRIDLRVLTRDIADTRHRRRQQFHAQGMDGH